MTKLTKREMDKLYVEIIELFELHDCTDEKDMKSMMSNICDVVNEAAYDYSKEKEIDDEHALIISE